MNLYDIVPVVKKSPRFSTTAVKAAVRTAEQILQLDAISGREELDRDESKALAGITTKMNRAFVRQRRAIADTAGALPESLWVKDEPLTRFAQSPRVALADVRSLADTFGFVVIPWEYFLQDKVTRDASEAVEEFVDEAELDDRFVPYVLCPVPYYSLQRHVAADEDLPIYAGPFGQAFMGINMSIPMFRQLARRVTDLESGSRNTGVRLDSVEAELTNLARRLGEMQRAEERRQREAVAAREREALAARIAAVKQFIPYDPMMLAIPSDKDVMSESIAVIGPCWGPDFDDVVALARGYKRIPGQRKMISRIGW